MMTALPTRRLLPLLMLMAFVMLGQRGYSFWHGWQYGVAATAQEPTASIPEPVAAAPKAEPKVEENPAPETASTPAAEPEKAESEAPAPAEQAEPDLDMPGEYTPAEVQVLQALSKRRAELEARTAEIDQREALLQVTENRVQEKLKELEGVRTELTALLKTVDGQQNARIASLVKMYETMKPQEAAAILETLEMPVALDILETMKETKSAPILAKMTPQKASEITVEMSRRHQLPELP
jgi:flagellar motility protein MotE (MotC chaperone)